MAKFGTPQLALTVVLVATLWAGTTAQSGCTSALISLSPCLSFIQGNSSTPSSSCCSQLSSIVSSQPQCLCTVLGGGASSLGITINQTQALALPDACNVKTPPVSRCNGAGAPTESPTPPGTTTPSPSTKQPSTPSSPSTPAGNGSKTVPTTGDSSAATSEMGSLRLSGQLLFLVFSASFALVLSPF